MRTPKGMYDWISPITGKYTVLAEPIVEGGKEVDKYFLDMGTGYHTYKNTWKEDNEDIIEQIEQNFPPFLIDSKVVDTSGSVWYPMFSNVMGIMLYPILEEGKMHWRVQRGRPIEKKNDAENPENVISTPATDMDGNVIYILQELGEVLLTTPRSEFEMAYDLFVQEYRSIYVNEEE